jgi:chemotaxis response regulator CheB
VLQHQGKLEQAVEAMRKVIYLDHADVLGHFGLANLHFESGQLPKAIKSLDNALRLLENRPPDDLVARSGGVTVSRLRDAIIRQQQHWKMQSIRIIGIAASPGGPSTLLNVLEPLTSDYPLPILVVQHVSQGFGTGLAEWLGSELKITVKLAQENEKPMPGKVYLAPDDFHMEVNMNGTIHLHKGPPYRGLRPSANYLFDSISKVYGKRAMGIILTGMGDDGAQGMLHLYQAGGLTIAQDRQSCIIYGMPKEAIDLGAVDVVLNPDQINYTLHQLATAQGYQPGGKSESNQAKGGRDGADR